MPFLTARAALPGGAAVTRLAGSTVSGLSAFAVVSEQSISFVTTQVRMKTGGFKVTLLSVGVVDCRLGHTLRFVQGALIGVAPSASCTSLDWLPTGGIIAAGNSEGLCAYCC